MGRLGANKRVVSVCRKLNLLENKATVTLSVADTCRLHESIHCLKESLINIICNQNYQVLCYFVFLMICLNNQAE